MADEQSKLPASGDVSALPPTHKKEEGDPITDLKGQVQGISSRLDGLVESLNQLVSSSSGNASGVVSGKAVSPESITTDENWQELFLTDPNRAVPLLIDHVKTEIKRDIQSNTTTQYWDAMSLEEFPDLKDKNSDHYKETVNIMHDKKKKSPDIWEKDPQLQYDAARIAYSNLVRAGKIKPQFEGSAGLVSEPMGAGSSIGPYAKVTRLSDLQRYIASEMGVPEDSIMKGRAS